MGLVTTYVLAVIIGSAGVTTWWGGAVTGTVVWIAIGALTSANTILYEDRPAGLWLLFSSYQLVVLTIAGVAQRLSASRITLDGAPPARREGAAECSTPFGITDYFGADALGE